MSYQRRSLFSACCKCGLQHQKKKNVHFTFYRPTANKHKPCIPSPSICVENLDQVQNYLEKFK